MTAPLQLEVVLDAPDPRTWLDTHLQARFNHREAEADLDAPAVVVSTAELLADDAALLRAAHARLVADGTPPSAAATYLADWYAGGLAGAVGYALATGGVGYLLTGRGEQDVRFHLHPDGWPLGVELPAHAVVAPHHPWAADPGCEVADDEAAVVVRAVQDLIAAVGPIVDACHRTARVGAAGLWNEVADALGKGLAFQHLVAPTPAMVSVLDAAVAVDGVPWRTRPRLAFARSDRLGDVHIVQKGGCCLAYTASADEVPSADDPGLTPYHRAYLTRFPADPEQPRYCSTCSFRDVADTTARQVFWHEHHASLADPAGGA